MGTSTNSIEEVLTQLFDSRAARFARKEGGTWTQSFIFLDLAFVKPGDLLNTDIEVPNYFRLDLCERQGLLKAGPSVPYQREFTTDDSPSEVVERIFPPIPERRRRASRPLSDLPTPFELLRGGPTQANVRELARFGLPGLEHFETELQRLVRQGPEGGVGDPEAYWLGWLIAQGEDAYREGADLEPPWDEDSWDPELGERVLFFPYQVRLLLDPGNRPGQTPAPERGHFQSEWLQSRQDDLDESYLDAQVTVEENTKVIEAYQRGERSADGGYPYPPRQPNPRTNAWYLAETTAGTKCSIRFLSADGSRYVESVGYFLVRDQERTADVLSDFLTEHTARLGTTLLAQEGPFRVTDASLPHSGVFYHKSYGGKSANIDQLRTLLYFD